MNKFIAKSTWRKKEQVHLMIELSGLLSQGLSLQEALYFEKVLYQNKTRYYTKLSRIYERLSEGYPLYKVFMDEGFSENIVSELKLSQLHGQLSETLVLMSKRLQTEEEKWQELLKILTYPIILILFVLGLFLVIKYCLFPQVQQYLTVPTTWSFWMLKHSGILFIGSLFIVMISLYSIRYYLKRYSALEKRCLYVKIPLLCYAYKTLSTYQFCSEWGTLLVLGIDTQHILKELQSDGHPCWVRELSLSIQKGMHRGESLATQLESYPFFTPGLIRFIKKGEVKGKLGEEMLLYADYLWKNWLKQLEIWMQWLQPIVFILIGFLIINIYISLLLPMYNSF